jgi:hypothetical protein
MPRAGAAPRTSPPNLRLHPTRPLPAMDRVADPPRNARPPGPAAVFDNPSDPCHRVLRNPCPEPHRLCSFRQGGSCR